jgi:hypothetical protein
VNISFVSSRFGKIVLYIVLALTLIGLVLHCVAANSVEGAMAVVLNFILLILTALLLLSLTFHSHRRLVLSSFCFFFAIYYIFSGFARINAAIFNPDLEIYQNSSDAATLFELSTDGTDLDSEVLSLTTDTRGALKVYAFIYHLTQLLGLPVTPSIGIMLNSILVAAGSAISMIGAKYVFPNSPKAIRLVAAFFATSGLAYMYSGLHLRDAFLYLLNALLFIVMLRINLNDSTKSVLLKFSSAFVLVLFMMMFREESFFIFFGFIATFAFEMIMKFKWKQRILLFGILGIPAVVMLQYILVYYADLIERTMETYHAIQGSTDGLASTLIINVPIWVRPIVGTLYMILGHVPFFAGFLFREWYYWFVSIQATQSLIVLPAFLFFVATYFNSKLSQPPNLFRRLFVFYLIMATVISLTTVSYRHMGQFLPYLYILAAFGYLNCSRTYRWFSVFILTVPVSLIWMAIKY